MPMFDVIHEETKEITEFWGSYAALQEHLKANPGTRQHYSVCNPGKLDAANYGNVATRQVPTDAFKKRLNQINKFHKVDTTNNMSY